NASSRLVFICAGLTLRCVAAEANSLTSMAQVLLSGESPMCDSYEARLVELFDAFKRREREGTKRVKESLDPERWLCRHGSFKALAYFVTIRMPLNRMNPSIQST